MAKPLRHEVGHLPILPGPIIVSTAKRRQHERRGDGRNVAAHIYTASRESEARRSTFRSRSFCYAVPIHIPPSCKLRRAELRRGYLLIHAAATHKLVMRAGADGLAAVEHDYLIRVADAADARDDYLRGIRELSAKLPSQRGVRYSRARRTRSSNISISGWRAIARAMARRCFCPPETLRPCWAMR